MVIFTMILLCWFLQSDNANLRDSESRGRQGVSLGMSRPYAGSVRRNDSRVRSWDGVRCSDAYRNKDHKADLGGPHFTDY
jgi:hypothetical protein